MQSGSLMATSCHASCASTERGRARGQAAATFLLPVATEPDKRTRTLGT